MRVHALDYMYIIHVPIYYQIVLFTATLLNFIRPIPSHGEFVVGWVVHCGLGGALWVGWCIVGWVVRRGLGGASWVGWCVVG